GAPGDARATGARTVHRLPQRAGRGRRLARRDLRRAGPADRLLALERRALLPARRQMPAGDGHRGGRGPGAPARQRVRRLGPRPAQSPALSRRPRRRDRARRPHQETRAGHDGAAGGAVRRAATGTERVERVLAQTPLIDGHNDLPWEIRARFGGDLAKIDLAASTAALPAPPDGAPLMTDIPRLRAGRVGAQFWSVWIPAATR